MDDVDVDMGMQKVTVMGWADKNKILKTVRRMGKRAELWPYPYNPEYHGYMRQYGGSTNSNSIINTNHDMMTSYNHNHNHYHDHESNFSKPVTSFFSIPRRSANYRKASSYNYYTHGYNNGDDFGYYQQPIGSSLVTNEAVTMFNDDNPHACSIM